MQFIVYFILESFTKFQGFDQTKIPTFLNFHRIIIQLFKL